MLVWVVRIRVMYGVASAPSMGPYKPARVSLLNVGVPAELKAPAKSETVAKKTRHPSIPILERMHLKKTLQEDRYGQVDGVRSAQRLIHLYVHVSEVVDYSFGRRTVTPGNIVQVPAKTHW